MGYRIAKKLALLSSAILVLCAGFAASDVNQDKTECTEKLVALASCLPYVSGEAKAPTLDCCTGLKDVIDKSKRCLCLLIKDRDDPSLGLKINLTLALSLPSACHTPTNITKCVDILHLSPKSPEAKVFEGIDSTAPSPVPAASAGVGGGGASKETGTQTKSGAARGKSNWLVSDVFCFGIFSFVLIFQLFFLV